MEETDPVDKYPSLFFQQHPERFSDTADKNPRGSSKQIVSRPETEHRETFSGVFQTIFVQIGLTDDRILKNFFDCVMIGVLQMV